MSTSNSERNSLDIFAYSTISVSAAGMCSKSGSTGGGPIMTHLATTWTHNLDDQFNGEAFHRLQVAQNL